MNPYDYDSLTDDEDEQLLADDLPPQAAPQSPLVLSSARNPALPEQVPGAPDEAVIKAIRDKRDRDVGLANAFQGISSLGAGIAGQKVDPSQFEAMRREAEIKAAEGTSDAKLKQKAVADFIKNQRQVEKDKQTAADKKEDNTRLNRALSENERHHKKMEESADEKAANKSQPGQQAVDREYGKEYAGRVAGGGYTMAEKGLGQLGEAIEKLRHTDTATGPIVSLIPDSVRSRLMPESQSIKDAVEEIVQRNLRPTLGAQFTENEGKQLIARAYNPALPESENIKRLQRLGAQMKQALATQKAADDYFNENGTLKGFNGKLYQNAADFDLGDKKDGSVKHSPGDVLTIKGKKYKVGANGDDLEPL